MHALAQLAWLLRHPTPGRLRTLRTYRALARSGRFDAEHYRRAHPGLAAGADPLLDYVEHGWRAGRDPSADFSTRGYLDSRPDVLEAGMNPLLHAVRYGRTATGGPVGRGRAGRASDRARRAVRSSAGIARDAARLGPGPFLSSVRTRLGRRSGDEREGGFMWPRPVTIVVAIHNAAEDLERCLAALARNTSGAARLILIDDASTDPRIGELLEGWGQRPDVTVLRNERNLGYTRTINRGIEHARGDVVLLNSDTEVTPRWLARLARTAYADPRIGTVTPVSNHAGAFSVPEIATENPVPDALTRDDVGRLVAQTSARLAPGTPTGSGFCLYIKRAVIDEIGDFDAESFPRGYGEENDFCMRAREHGWRHVVDDATFIFHRREASFGAEKDQLLRHARARVSELHPSYDRLVRRFVHSPRMRAVRRRVRHAFATAGSRPPRPRVLFVLHEGGGGTAETSRDLLRGLAEAYDCLLLTSNTRTLKLWRQEATGLVPLKRWRLARRWRPTDFSRSDFRAVARQVLVEHEVELVHVRHLMKHSFDLPRVAAELGIPVVVSFHDYYLSCPTVHLLDDQDRYCGGICTAGEGSCRIPTSLLRGLPPLKHRWVYFWRSEVASMLETASVLVTTSPHARDVHRRSLPSLESKRFEVIPHGRDLEQASGVGAEPVPGGPIRVLVAGNLDVHKGAELIRALRAEDRAGRLEFHFLGEVPDRYADLGALHGPYLRSSFAARARVIAPAFVGIFSIWAETYNHVLTEAWAAGVPVLVTDLGALAERVADHGGGWTLPHDDPAAALARIEQIADDPAEYGREADRATVEGLPDVAAMARAYADLYERTLDGERAFPESPSDARGTRAPRTRAGRLELAAFVPGTGGHYPGSTHVRVLRRLEHPTVRSRIDARLTTPDDPPRLPAGTDLALVQRTAIAPDSVRPFVSELRAAGVPLVVELDDDLLAKDTADRTYGPHRESLSRLLDAADLVTVSTERLGAALGDRAERVVVVPNMLDERLWLSEPPATGREADGAVQLVYIGTKTHADDLALLRPALDRLRTDLGMDVELSVIGGERRSPQPPWYRRVEVPRGFSSYPLFVEWLRGQSARWDVAVAPLVDDDFNRSKSDLKFLEYTGLGLPAVLSAVPAYSTCVDGRTGLLAPNTVEGWTEALARLCRDADLRARLVAEAQGYVFTRRLLGPTLDQYLDLLCELVVDRHAVPTPGASPAVSTALATPAPRPPRAGAAREPAAAEGRG